MGRGGRGADVPRAKSSLDTVGSRKAPIPEQRPGYAKLICMTLKPADYVSVASWENIPTRPQKKVPPARNMLYVCAQFVVETILTQLVSNLTI